MKNNIGIVIQGKYNDTFLKSLDHYKTFGHVVLSCYEDDNIPEDLGIEIVKCNDKIEGYNDLNIFRQSNTTLNGLKKLKTDYAIKVRTDESWHLDIFAYLLMLYPYKYTTNNIHFTNDPLHPSDHVIGSTTENLLKTFNLAKQACIDGKTLSSQETLSGLFDLGGLRFGPEQVLFNSFLVSNYLHWPKVRNLPQEYTDKNKMNELMKLYTQCVNIEYMKPYIWTQDYSPRRFFEDTETLYDSHNPSIKHISEYNCK